MKKKQNNNLSDLKAKKRAAISLDTEQANVDGHLKKMNLLALLLNFEKYWSPYSLSDGSLYRSEVKEEAKKVVDLFNELYGQNDSMTPSNILVKPDDLQTQRIFILSLKSWLNTDSLYPNINQQDMIVNRNRCFFQQVLSDFENKLANELGLPIKMTFSATSYEELFHKNVLKWAAQLPNEIIPKIDDAYIENMSRYDTLVVVGDIRRSQDLMTYGSSPEVYRDKIIEFMNRTREILKNNCGLYDRFTGDGFIAYFNKYMCEQEGKDYYEMMIKACREILNFSNPFFEDWVKLLRRIPEKDIGLCIGVDSGIVSFKDLNNQLFAIGDACVWATRMNSAGMKGDLVLNNIPYQHISHILNENNCVKINSITKGGEHFSAYRLQINNIHYVSDKKPQEHREPGAIA